MPRKAHPIDILKFDAKKHLGKNEVIERLNNEIQLGTTEFKAPPYVKIFKYAKKRWNEVIKLYSDAGLNFVTTADTALLERYSIEYATYHFLLDIWDIIKKSSYGKKSRDGSDVDPNVYEFRMLSEYDILNKLSKSSGNLLKMEAELYLTPASRVSNVEREARKKEESDPLKELGFGNV